MRRANRSMPGALGRYFTEVNLAFVIKVANEYRWTGVPVEDLVNAGNLGLIGAARRFDVNRNVRFTTYAAFWVRKAILEAVAEESRVVRLPAYHMQMQREILDAESFLRRRLGRRPSRNELADHLSMNVGRLERLLRHGGGEISIDEPLDDARGTTLSDRLVDSEEPSIERKILLKELTDSLERLLGELDRRQRTVLKLRFGLEGARPSSLSEIGRRLKVSRERVRQIERGAIRSIRDSLGAPGRGALLSGPCRPRVPQMRVAQ
jgi:RNA polymerase primary sigma factor